MKIYLASSWKQAANVMTLKHMLEGHGHQVDAFCDTESGQRYVFSFDNLPVHTDALTNLNIRELPEVRRAFDEDKKWLDWADACLLVLPSGKSAHLEAGYAKGRGKPLVIYQPEFTTGDFDVMYGFADLITDDTGQIIEFFSRSENMVKNRSDCRYLENNQIDEHFIDQVSIHADINLDVVREVLVSAQALVVKDETFKLGDQAGWETYVHGSIREGQWVMVWTKDGEEPVFAQYFEDCTEDCGVADPGFVNEDGWGVLEEEVSHIMRIKPPDGQNAYWK